MTERLKLHLLQIHGAHEGDYIDPVRRHENGHVNRKYTHEVTDLYLNLDEAEDDYLFKTPTWRDPY